MQKVKSMFAVSAGLALFAVGTAVAVGPIIQPPIRWTGGVNITQDAVAPTYLRHAYTVPAGHNFMLTDIVISNASNTLAVDQKIYVGQGSSCNSPGPYRTTHLTVPAGQTLHLPFVTGLGFTAGQAVCLVNYDVDSTTNWMLRGFLFTATPST